MKRCFFILLILLCTLNLFAQKVKTELIGSIVDPDFNSAIPSATISTYLKSDSSIIQYSLSDGNGNFKLENLPQNVKIIVVVSFLGYKKAIRETEFVSQQTIDLGKINLTKNKQEIEEVVIVGLPPVQLNGDTLEFNADAFKMDPNAVAEDLIKKLPGVTLWGDGAITVNGRPISSLLVNGKQFFGGDHKVATQNINKEAIAKIQVYQKENSSILDSISEMNIMLKNKDSLKYFGKAEASRGIEKRYDENLNFNMFNDKTQISAIYGRNNVNKFSTDINILLRNSTFKGLSISSENDSDYETKGEIKSLNTGLLMQHSVRPQQSNKYKNNLKISYLFNKADKITKNDLETLTPTLLDEIQIRKTNSSGENSLNNNAFYFNYDFLKNNFNMSINGEMNKKNENDHISNFDSISDNNENILSNLMEENKNSFKGQNFNINLTMVHVKDKDESYKIPGDWKLDISILKQENNIKALNYSKFNSLITKNADFEINRSTDRNEGETQYSTVFEIGNFWNTLFNQSYNKSLNLISDFNFINRNRSNDVFDLSDNDRNLNDFLSFRRREHILNYKPGLLFRKTYLKQLSGRFSNSGEFAVSSSYQFYQLTSTSDNYYQNISKQYNKILPKIYFSRTQNKIGKYINDYKITLESIYDFPEVEQLAPVVDSSIVFNINVGNKDLNPSRKISLNTTFSHRSFQENTLIYGGSLELSRVHDQISYILEVDSIGRSFIKPINVKNDKSLMVSGNISKAFKFDSNQILFKFGGNLNFYEKPFYFVNTNDLILNKYFNTRISTNLDVTYNHEDLFTINLKHKYNYYKSIQLKSDNKLLNKFHRIELNTLFNINKNVVFVSNFGLNNNTFYNLSTKYSILNIKVSYRMLKKKNLQILASCYDVFNQNQSFQIRNLGNIVSQERNNVLGRYFMMSLSYYPQKFK